MVSGSKVMDRFVSAYGDTSFAHRCSSPIRKLLSLSCVHKHKRQSRDAAVDAPGCIKGTDGYFKNLRERGMKYPLPVGNRGKHEMVRPSNCAMAWSSIGPDPARRRMRLM